MDRTVSFKFKGRELTFNYSIEIMFLMTEKFGNIQKALEIIGTDNKEGFSAIQWFTVNLANDGELCRRESGYDPQPMISEKDVSARMHPLEYKELREAVIEAIMNGYRREMQDENEEIDLGLAELEAKKTEAGV